MSTSTTFASLRQLRRQPVVAALALVAAPVMLGGGAHAQSYTFTTLHVFTGGADGSYPDGGLTLDTDGNIYGTTQTTIYEIPAGTNMVTSVASLNSQTGIVPVSPLTPDSSGNLYGASTIAGANGGGGLFEYSLSTNTVSSLASFSTMGLPDGDIGSVAIDSSGNVYGTTSTRNAGLTPAILYKYSPVTQSLTTLVTFNSNTGTDPTGLIIDGAGNLYGITADGGKLFQYNTSTSTYKTLVSLTVANGAIASSNLVSDGKGDLYGETASGGADGDGTLFEYDLNTQTLTTLYSFAGLADGNDPGGSLAIDANGNLFGTTDEAGADGDGTVFEFLPSSQSLRTLDSFTGSNEVPTGITLDNSGDLFGTTEFTGGAGSVFELTPVGSATAPEPCTLLLLLPAAGYTAGQFRRKAAAQPCKG